MTYYHSPHDDYKGFYAVKKSSSLRNALAGLRKSMVRNDEQSGMIATKELPGHLGSRNPNGYVGTMVEISGKKKKADFNGRKITVLSKEYIWIPKGMRKEYLVMADGSLRAYERR